MRLRHNNIEARVGGRVERDRGRFTVSTDTRGTLTVLMPYQPLAAFAGQISRFMLCFVEGCEALYAAYRAERRGVGNDELRGGSGDDDYNFFLGDGIDVRRHQGAVRGAAVVCGVEANARLPRRRPARSRRAVPRSRA